jgi:choice-of-anchor B domain-containing protein
LLRITLILLFLLPVTGINAQSSKNVELLDVWTTNDVPLNNDGSKFNGCWGFEHNGIEYAVMGSTAGTHIFRITANNQLQEIDFIPGTSIHTTTSNNIHREYKSYKNYLYGVCDEGNSTLQIMDMNSLPDSVTLVANDDEFFYRAHDIYIDSAKATMYVCGPKDSSGLVAMMVLSLADPVHPAWLYTYTDTWYVHGAYVRNDTAYLNCANNGLRIYKFNNGANPVLLNYLDIYPEQGYNHSGWLSEDGKHYVFTDESQGKRIKLCDVSDLTDINILDFFNSGGDAQTVAHVVMWKDDYVYASHYYDGLQVFDARNKSNVKKVAWYDTHEGTGAYQGAWGVYSFFKDNKVIISDRNSGLFLFKVNLPPDISTDGEFGIYPNPTSEEAMFYYENEEELYYQFKVYDALGKLVFQKENINSNFLRFDVSQWNSGTYFYHWEGEDNTVSLKGKFIIAK